MPHTRQEKPFSEKLKAFFRVGKTHGFPRHQEAELVGDILLYHVTPLALQVLSSETLSELGQDQALATRLRVVRELQGQVDLTVYTCTVHKCTVFTCILHNSHTMDLLC